MFIKLYLFVKENSDLISTIFKIAYCVIGIFMIIKFMFLGIWEASVKRSKYGYPINLEKRSNLFKWIEAYNSRTLDNLTGILQGYFHNDRKLRDYYNELNVIQK